MRRVINIYIFLVSAINTRALDVKVALSQEAFNFASLYFGEY